MIAFKRLAEVMMEKYGIYVPLSEAGYDNFVHPVQKTILTIHNNL